MTTSRTALHDRLTALLVDRFGIPGAAAVPGATFDDLGVDSLVIVEFALLLKKEFGVLLTDGELRASDTVADAATLLDARGVTA